MSTNKKTALCIAIVVTLSACGGGGESSDSTPAANTAAPIIITSSAVSVDASIPASVRQQVAEIVSSVASVDKIPSAIAVGEGEDIVLALDAQGKILMTGVAAADGTTAFNAASTAVGLVSFALDTPENLTEKQVNDKIRAAAGFAQLTERVDTALKLGKIASIEPSVLEKVLLVAQQVKKSTVVSIQSKAVQSAITARMLPTTPAVTTDYPFDLVKSEIWIGKVSFDTNKTVKNTIPLAWSVVAKNSKGEVLPNGDLIVQPAGMGSRSVDAIGNTFGGIFTFLGRLTSPSVAVPDDNGKSFELTVAQTPEILQYNKAHALVDTILKGLDLKADAGGECQLAYVKAVMGSKDISNLLTADPDNIMSQLDQWQANTLSMTNVLSASADVLDKCGSQATKDTIESQAKLISTKMAYFVPIYRELKAVKKTYDFASIAERFFLISHYQDEEPAIYTVCINKNGGVDNCAVEYQISEFVTDGTFFNSSLPVNSPMTAGVKFGVSVTAKDENGNSTLVPAELEFVINDPSLLSYDPKTQKFTTLAAGRPTIGVRDKVTTAKSLESIAVNIDAPRLNKTKITLKVDESITLPLQNAQGQNIVLNGMTDWGNGDPLVASLKFGTLGTISDLKNQATSITIKGLKEGTMQILGVNSKDSSRTEGLDVTVREPSNYVKIGATGQQLPDSASVWDCVLDKKTGLIWENKTKDGGLRDYRHTYSWFEDSSGYADNLDYYTPRNGFDTVPSGQEPYGFYCSNTLAKCNTRAFIAAVNNQKLCGYSDWRLPNKDELVTIGTKQDKFDYFINISSWTYLWSSHPAPAPAPICDNCAWYVNFNKGDLSRNGKSGNGGVMAIRASQ
jgi:hypothetical protein